MYSPNFAKLQYMTLGCAGRRYILAPVLEILCCFFFVLSVSCCTLFHVVHYFMLYIISCCTLFHVVHYFMLYIISGCTLFHVVHYIMLQVILRKVQEKDVNMLMEKDQLKKQQKQRVAFGMFGKSLHGVTVWLKPPLEINTKLGM